MKKRELKEPKEVNLENEFNPEVSSRTLDEIDDEKEKDALKKIEAVLFVSGRFLNLQELISYTDLNPILLRELIEKLKEKFEREDSSIEISVIRNSFKHGKKSYGWSGNDKLILFNSLDLIDSKESIEWMIQVAETVAEALNSKKL